MTRTKCYFDCLFSLLVRAKCHLEILSELSNFKVLFVHEAECRMAISDMIYFFDGGFLPKSKVSIPTFLYLLVFNYATKSVILRLTCSGNRSSFHPAGCGSLGFCAP